MVHTFNHEWPKKGFGSYESQGYREFVDGDMNEVRVVDEEPDRGPKFRLGMAHEYGRPVLPENVPTKLAWQGKSGQPIPDFIKAPLAWVITDRVREVIERHDPGVHQFFPLDVTYEDGSRPLDERFLLIIGRRLDTVDQEQTTWPFGNVLYKTHKGGKLVLSSKKIGDAALWIEACVGSGRYMSDALVEGLRAIGATGFKFKEQETSA